MQLPDIPGLTPEHLRESSNLAHTVEGALLLAAATIAVTQALGRFRGGWREQLWPALLMGAGMFLLVYLPSHHGIDAVPSVLRYAAGDAQQRQHFLLAALALVGGGGAFLARRARRRARSGAVQDAAFSIALVAIGLVFLLHPQHGTTDAVSRARVLHLIIGSLFLTTGAMHLWSTLRPASRALALAWPVMLALTGASLLFYREPPGAYAPQDAHGAAHAPKVPAPR